MESQGAPYPGRRGVSAIVGVARPDLKLLYDAIEKLHINFYEDAMELDDIATSITGAKTLLAELETLRQQPPRSVALDSRERRLRWRRLPANCWTWGQRPA